MNSVDKTNKILNVLLNILTAGVVLVSYLALYAVPDYGSMALIIPVIPILLSFFVDKLEKLIPYYTKVIQIPLLCLGLFLPIIVSVLGILHAVMLLTSAIQLTLLVYPKGIREYLYLIFMSFFLFLGAGAQAPEPIVGFAIVLFICFVVVLLPITTMSESVRRTEETESAEVSVITPISTKKNSRIWITFGILFILVWSLIFLGFTYIPRVEAGLLGRDIGLRARTGIPQSVSLRGGESIELSPTPVLSAYFPDASDMQPIPEEKLYWRVTTLPVYLGNQWRRWPLERSYEPTESDNFLYFLRKVQSRTQEKQLRVDTVSIFGRKVPYRRFAYEVYLDKVPEVGLPLLDKVQGFSSPKTGSQVVLGWDNTRDATVVLSTSGVRRLVYAGISDIIDWLPEKLRGANDNYKEVLTEQDYKILTQEDLTGRTREIIQEIVRGKETVYDKVKAIEEWLSGPEFRYSLNVPPLPLEHPIDAFLLEFKSGHCELFASAMALAVRSLGIPARVVSGYRGGEWDPDTKSYLVREGMAHLWVEVLFLDYGWVPFDPSPRGVDLQMFENMYLRLLSRFLLRGKIFWYRRIVGFDRGYQLPTLDFLNIGIFKGIDEIINPGGNRMIPSTSLFLFGLILLVFLLMAFKLLATLWVIIKSIIIQGLPKGTRKTIKFTPEQLQARNLFLLLEKTFKKAGWDISSMTVEEIDRQLCEKQFEFSEDIRKFLGEYNAVRFGFARWQPGKVTFWRKKIPVWATALANYFNNRKKLSLQ